MEINLQTKIGALLDASPIIEEGQSPMSEIMHLSKELERGMIMKLTAPFRPEPIMDMLKSKGFMVWYKNHQCFILKSE